MENYPGEHEQHLPHESWHVVQERSNRRRSTLNHKGAEFIGYSSPTKKTDERFPIWRIEVSQGNWQDEIVPGNNPLHSPGLSGEFAVKVFVRCPKTGEYLLWKDKEGNETGSVVCNDDNTAMIIFYATSDVGCEGTYYTVPNALGNTE